MENGPKLSLVYEKDKIASCLWPEAYKQKMEGPLERAKERYRNQPV